MCGALKGLKSGREIRANRLLGAPPILACAPRQFALAFSIEFKLTRRDDLKE